MHEAITTCEKFTRERIDSIRTALADRLKNSTYTVVTGGSYARGEASVLSDLDYFLISNSEPEKKHAETDREAIKAYFQEVVSKEHATGGAFGHVGSLEEMTQNIGGDLDTNHKITRRVLFLMEGEWLYNEKLFNTVTDHLLGRYINSNISDHQFCRFFLNDLIRYYRTICVDFEHKTAEQGKAWGTRNLKLIFSRKLLYFSGVLVVAETWQHTYEHKRETMKTLLGLTPIQRINSVCGARADAVLTAYGEFLRKMSDPEIRAMTESVTDIRKDQPSIFRLFKNEGHHFSWMLSKLLKDTYDASHPIHNALVV